MMTMKAGVCGTHSRYT